MTANSVDYLNQCFHLNMEEWALYWKTRPLHHFKDLRSCNRWNTIYAGTASGFENRSGRTYYRIVKLDSKSLPAHRIIWAMVRGVWPESDIDHIDGNGLNNSISNLRLCGVENFNNSRNRILSVSNSSGRTGVSYRKDRNTWEVFISLWEDNRLVKRVRKSFKNYCDAVVYRESLEKEYNFSFRVGNEAYN